MAPFHYRHLGSFAFIGADNAVLEVPLNGKQPSGFTGFLTGLLWKGLESYEQISLKVRPPAPSSSRILSLSSAQNNTITTAPADNMTCVETICVPVKAPTKWFLDVQNKFYVALDWCKTKVFGRDTGGKLDVHLPPRSLSLSAHSKLSRPSTQSHVVTDGVTHAVQMCIDWLCKRTLGMRHGHARVTRHWLFDVVYTSVSVPKAFLPYLILFIQLCGAKLV